MPQTLYFGHPINTYDTPLEEKIENELQALFPRHNILNPNQKVHEEGYQQEKRNSGNGMLYFFEKVLPQADKGIFLPFTDRKFSTGQFKEAEYLFQNNKPIYEIFMVGNLYGTLPLSLDKTRQLSVSETRKRIKKPY